MKNKALIIVALTVFCLSIGYVGFNRINNYKSNLSKDENTNAIYINEDIDSNKIIDENKGTIVKSKYPVEKGFLTTINPIGTEEELIKNNNLIVSNGRISVQERLKAKNVAENFVQAIVSIDKSKIEESAERAKKYVVSEKKKEVEDLYMFLGKNQNEKAYLVEEICSYEEKNKEENDYVYFDVYTKALAIDQYDQKVNFGNPTYNVQLLQLNGKWQVVQYRII